MFGVGKDTSEDQEEKEEVLDEELENSAEDLVGDIEADAFFKETVQAKTSRTAAKVSSNEKYQTTILAPGSVFEGTLHAKGDVDLACEFKGDIFAEGDVTLHISLDGNVQGKCVELCSCAINGDIKATSVVRIQEGSSIQGNIATQDLVCSGQVQGDVVASGHVTLARNAKMLGNVTASTISIEQGSIVDGNLKVKRA